MSLSRRNLGTVKNYSIDLVTKDANTFSVQIVDSNTRGLVADLPLDPMDNTLAGVLNKYELQELGEDAEPVLKVLSELLQEHIGAKEFIVLPAGANLPGFVPAQDAAFKRLRHANRADLEKKTASILEQYSVLTAELNESYECLTGMSAIEKGLQHDKPNEEIHGFLLGHANFTVGKTNEYKDEDIQGKKARFNNSKVVPLALLNSSHRLCGVIRALSMGNRFAYLSDETVNQEIISAEKFPGSTIDEQKKNRNIFLLAYLLNKTCAALQDQDHLLMIAASEREDIYAAVGMQTFPIQSNDYVVTMKLILKPGLALTAIKEKLIKPFSEVGAINVLGLTPAPVVVATAANADEPQLQSFAQNKQ
jgi:hypothetical protein